jgi:tellurite resistance protein TerC
MQTIGPLWLWATFVGIVLVSLFVDLVVLRKQGAQDIGVKEALTWSLVWIALSFLFNGLFVGIGPTCKRR